MASFKTPTCRTLPDSEQAIYECPMYGTLRRIPEERTIFLHPAQLLGRVLVEDLFLGHLITLAIIAHKQHVMQRGGDHRADNGGADGEAEAEGVRGCLYSSSGGEHGSGGHVPTRGAHLRAEEDVRADTSATDAPEEHQETNGRCTLGGIGEVLGRPCADLGRISGVQRYTHRIVQW
jgi:hypothetical protein